MRDRALRAQGLKQRETSRLRTLRMNTEGGRQEGELARRAKEEAVSRSRKWSARSGAIERSGKVGP